MKRLVLLLVVMLLVAVPVLGQEDAWPRTVVDGLGAEVTIDAPPQRIVTLNLAAEETLLPLVGPERFVGVTLFSVDPAISNVAVAASQVPNTNISTETIEEIIELNPDLVFVASFTAPEIIQQLRDVGLTVFATGSPSSLDDIRANTRLLGEAVGAETAADDAVAAMDAAIGEITDLVASVEEPDTVLYLTPGNYTSGANSTIADIIQTAGGVDIAAAAGLDQLAPVSDEFIIEQNPDVILLAGWTPWDPTFVDNFRNNPAFAGLDAVQNDEVYVSDDTHLTTVSPFAAEGVRDVAAYLYPDLYPAFPVTVTDAAGNDVTVPAQPRTLAVIGEANGDALRTLLQNTDGPGYDLLVVDLEDGQIGGEGDVVVFTPAPAEDLPAISGADTVTHVRIYPGDTAAEIVENIRIMGQALAQRVAALNTVAVYGDSLEIAAQ